jgi:hypothetical protein
MYEMRVVRRGGPDLRYMLFAPDDATVLGRLVLWASVQPGRDDWLQLVIERPDSAPPGVMRVCIDGPFDRQVPPGTIADVRLDG